MRKPFSDALLPDEKPEEGLIRPIKRRMDPDIGRDVVLVITPGDLAHLLKEAGAGNYLCFDMGFFKLYQVKKRGGGSFSVIGPFLGAPHAVMGMEKIIALGAGRIWGFGWCGSIQPDLRVGDLVIPTDAISEEGTSKHYPIGQKPSCSDAVLSKSLETWVSRRCVQNYRKGTVWTTDAPYRETPAKVRCFQQRGALAVDMEMSALMTLAIFRSVSFAALLVVSDELFDFKWRPGFKNPIFRDACRSAGALILEVVDAQDR